MHVSNLFSHCWKVFQERFACVYKEPVAFYKNVQRTREFRVITVLYLRRLHKPRDVSSRLRGR